MYISGVPGTGKTATVTAVVKSMTGCVDEDGSGVIPPFKFVAVNGMQVSQPHQIYPQIHEVSCPMSIMASLGCVSKLAS